MQPITKATCALLLLVASLGLATTACDRQQTDEPAAEAVSAEGDRAGAAAGVEARMKEPFGPYLTDAEGRSLYLFEPDEGAEGSTCYDECAKRWPPLTTVGEPMAGEGIDASMLGSIMRRDGQTQVTYGGWPLYYWMNDEGPGETTGQDIEDSGGEWYLVTPAGEKVHAEGEEHEEAEGGVY